MMIKQLNDPSKELSTVLIPCVNGASAALAHGDVVVKDTAAQIIAVAADAKVCPEEVTTTTNADDPLLVGVVYDPEGYGIAVGGVCQVMIRGYHPAVKVDGTTDITAGDFLATFTTAKYAAKANATKVVGAILGVALLGETDTIAAGATPIPVFIDVK